MPFAFQRPSHSTFFLADSDRIQVRFYWNATDEQFAARVWFGPGAAGPPGFAHGGAIFAVLDEAMGAATWARGHRVLAADLSIQYRQLVPLEQTYRIKVEIDRTEGERKIWVKSRLESEDQVYSTASGLFIRPPEEKLREFEARGLNLD